MSIRRKKDWSPLGSSATSVNTSGAAELLWRRALKGRRSKKFTDIVSFNKTGTQIPLYVFPSLSLGGTEYLELGKYIDPEQPWHVLIPPIKECRTEPEGLIRELAIRFADCLDEIHPKRQPIVVGGFSAGVTPALELARQLRARGRNVPLLIAIDMAPENTGVTEVGNSAGNKIRSSIHDSRQRGRNWPRTAIDLARATFNRASNTVFRRKLDDVDKFQKEYPTIPADDIKQMRIFYAAAFACSRPEPYDGKVLVIEASYALHQRTKAKWKSFAHDVESVVVEGTHSSIVCYEDAAKLADVLNRRLSALSSSSCDSQPLSF